MGNPGTVNIDQGSKFQPLKMLVQKNVITVRCKRVIKQLQFLKSFFQYFKPVYMNAVTGHGF